MASHHSAAHHHQQRSEVLVMQKVNHTLSDMGLAVSLEPLMSVKKFRQKFVKIAGESKAERRMRRRAMTR